MSSAAHGRFRVLVLLILAGALIASVSVSRAADALPSQLSDAEFWKMVTDFSEPDGPFPYENFVSNESSYQNAIPEVKRFVQPGGVYIGVAPDQNFTYIAAIEPKIAFVVDIRRQNTLELLMYKALFEMSTNRVEFVSRLFSRPRPKSLTDNLSVEELFKQINATKRSESLQKETIQAIKDRLVKQHQFGLSPKDVDRIEYIFKVFYDGGPRMDYKFQSSTPTQNVPSFEALMLATDRQGKNWSFLATNAAYDRVREMQVKNLIVPLVGDFAGSKTLQAIAAYLKSRSATTSVFYISNVEYYIQTEPSWNHYQNNIKALPVDSNSRYIRWVSATNITSVLPLVPVPVYTRDR
jgi:hypothetical protein